MATELLRALLVTLLARAVAEALRGWGVVGAGAEVEGAVAEWLGHTLDFACFLLAEALRARERRRRLERDS